MTNQKTISVRCMKCGGPIMLGRCPRQIRIYYEAINVKELEEEYFHCPACCPSCKKVSENEKSN